MVYRATDQALRRRVALKVLAPHMLNDSTARARFQREIETAIGVEHPNVVPVYQAGFEQGHFFIAMRLVSGEDLGRVIASRPMDPRRALRLFEQVAGALSHVHRQGPVHRDIKPQNILVSEPGEIHEYALLTDFGIARALDQSTALTRGIIGSAPYIAPGAAVASRYAPVRPILPCFDALRHVVRGRIPIGIANSPARTCTSPCPTCPPLPRPFQPKWVWRLNAHLRRNLPPGFLRSQRSSLRFPRLHVR